MAATAVLWAVPAGFVGAAQNIHDEPITPISQTAAADARKAVLGELLFHDRRLSSSSRISCQSCHDVQSNGATGRRFDVGADGEASKLNTPTVFNASLNFRLNWEGNQRRLEDLVVGSLRKPELMGGDGPPVIARLQADTNLAARFRTIYGRKIDETGVTDALSEFIRTLTTPDSRFDRWLEGDASALNTQEARGYARFKAVGCVSCHQGAGVGGNLFERSGVFHPLVSPSHTTLRVPSLRNVAATAPYFHDGSAKTLNLAVRAMARSQLDLRLSPADVDDIVAFLETLTGRYRGRVVTSGPSGVP